MIAATIASSQMPRPGKLWLLGLVWLAAVFRLPALFANTFHADEALFATWARLIAVWRDPLLQTQLLDKPPLLFYLQAIFYPLFGPVAWAARLPGFIASLLLVPLVGLWAWRLYGEEVTAVTAAVFIALAPLTIQFSATAFIDPLLATLLVAALVGASGQGLVAGSRWLVASDKTGVRIYGQRPATSYPFWSGFFFGLAVATKYQAWLFLPLLLGAAALCGWGRPQWRRWLAGFLPVLLLLVLWAMARPGTLALWPTQLDNFGGVRPVWSWELWPRLKAWLAWGRLAVGSPLLVGALIVSLFLLLFSSWRWHDRPAGFDLLLILYGLSYFLVHWLLAVPAWDRYLLPLMPVMGLILGRGLAQINIDSFFSPQWRGQACPGRETGHNIARFLAWSERRRGWRTKNRPSPGHHILFSLLLLLSLPTAVAARHGRYPIGGRPAADQGAAQIAHYLEAAPYGTVLYDHWFSWQWRYLLFDRRVFVSWFPHPAALVEDLLVFGRDGQPRYLALPDSAVARPIRRAVMAAGFQLHPVPLKDPAGILLYQILPQEQPE